LSTGITLWGPNVPTHIVIPVSSNLMGIFFLVPMMKQAYKSHRMIENVKMQKVLSDAYGLAYSKRTIDIPIEYIGMSIVLLLLCLRLYCLPYIF